MDLDEILDNLEDLAKRSGRSDVLCVIKSNLKMIDSNRLTEKQRARVHSLKEKNIVH